MKVYLFYFHCKLHSVYMNGVKKNKKLMLHVEEQEMSRTAYPEQCRVQQEGLLML